MVAALQGARKDCVCQNVNKHSWHICKVGNTCPLHGTGAYVLPSKLFDKIIGFYDAHTDWHDADALVIDMWTWEDLPTQLLRPQLMVQPDHDYLTQQTKPTQGALAPGCSRTMG